MNSWSSGGGGLADQLLHQRVSTTAGASQERTARRATGQLGVAGVPRDGWGRWGSAAPPLCPLGGREGTPDSFLCGAVGEPAEGERAVDKHLVTADRESGADLEVGP